MPPAGYGQWAAPMSAPQTTVDLAALDKNRKLAVAGFFVYVGLEALAFLGHVLAMVSGGTAAEAARNPAVTILVGVPGALLFWVQLFTWITLAMWMSKAATNVRAFGRVRPSWAPPWAWFSWLIPMASYVIPALMFKELRNGAGGTKADARIAPYWTVWVLANTVPSLLTVGLILPKYLEVLDKLQSDASPGAGLPAVIERVSSAIQTVLGPGTVAQVVLTGTTTLLLLGAAVLGARMLAQITEVQKRAAASGGTAMAVPYSPTEGL